MDDRERKQLDRIIAHEAAVAGESLDARMQALFRQQSAAGMLASGNTIGLAVKVCGEQSEAFMATIVAGAQGVRADLDAFAAIESAISAFFEVCRKQMRIALGHALRTPMPREEAAGWEIFEKRCATIEAKLAIARFGFEETAPAAVPHRTPERKSTGRLPAAFWDDMWAYMAAGLYDGSLIPKSQADVERIMSEWISANGFSASTSTVRLRAERLWPLIAPDRK